MRLSFATLIRSLACASLVLSALGFGAPASSTLAASPNPAWPAYLQPVENAAAQPKHDQPLSLASGRVQLVVEINLAPLAAVGKNWSYAERRAYAEKIRAAQDALIPQIEALGGQVVGRFTHLSAGLAVTMEADHVNQLQGLATVVDVSGVADYSLDLTQTVPWIGADELQKLGVTGLHGVTGQGLDVAVIDSGVDYTHVKLGGTGRAADYQACASHSDTLPPSPALTKLVGKKLGAEKTDPANPCTAFPNAKVVGGWDWVGERWPISSTVIEPDPNPIDYQGHGTHVADILGGLESAPGAGDAGVAPGVRLWAFKACSALTSSCNGQALLLALDNAMDLDGSDYGACTPGVDAQCRVYDPAAVVNLSLGTPFGQPEDKLTHFVNLAAYYGSVVVVAAGNSGDRPFIISSPSIAAGAISVAETTRPDAGLYTVQAGAVSAQGAWQPWSPLFKNQLKGTLQYGDGAANLSGCAPFAPGSLSGKILLVDRGGCNVSLKGAYGAAAGAALVLVADDGFGNTPPLFGFGGDGGLGLHSPVMTLSQADGAALKQALGAQASTSRDAFTPLPDDIVTTSSRGPRINDGAIKPDIAAPGGSVSAAIGTGQGTSPFGGTSGAAPMVAGAAALMIQTLEQRGILPDISSGVTLTDTISGTVYSLSAAPLVKALLMNTAYPDTKIGGFFPAPVTLQGAGRVDALAAYQSGTIAIDVTNLNQWASTGTSLPCQLTSSPTIVAVTNLILPAYYNKSYGCLSAFPFGNEFFNAWNAASGSLSFGYASVAGSFSAERKLLVVNLSDQPRHYSLDADFRSSDDGHEACDSKKHDHEACEPRDEERNEQGEEADDASALAPAHFTGSNGHPPQPDCPFGGAARPCDHPGLVLSIAPHQATIPAHGFVLADVTLKINAKGLPDWTLDAGKFGASGTNIHCSDPNPRNGCPTLTMFEQDGFVTVDGGEANVIHVPWQVLPKKAAQTEILKRNAGSVKLRNPAHYKPGDTDVFALMEISPNNCELVQSGKCLDPNYVPGILPGINGTAVDLHEVGVRSSIAPGVSAAFGLPPDPSGAVNDTVVDFGLTVYDKPFRASHDYPVEFDIFIDTNGDDVPDYLVFNQDLAAGVDGRNAVFVKDLNAAHSALPVRPYFFTATNFNSQNWILPVPAAAIGVQDSRPFRFFVLALDSYFSHSAWDCAPFGCNSFFTFQTGLPKYRPVTTALQVPMRGTYTLTFSQPAGGAAASPSQVGLLFMFRDARTGAESANVLLP